MPLNYVQTNNFYQAGSGSIIGATSIVLTSFTDIYGNVLTMSDFGSLGYITLEPDTLNEESATFTGVTANANGTYTLTGVKSALAKNPYTQTSGLVRGHSGGTKVCVSDTTAFWNTFANTQNDNDFVGYNTVPTPIGMSDIANKQYVLDQAAGGPVSIDAVIEQGIAGENLSEGNLIYFSLADGKWLKTDGTDYSTLFNVKLGIAQSDTNIDEFINDGVLTFGTDATNTSLSAEQLYYASDTPGEISDTPGTITRVIGIALFNNRLYFDPFFRSNANQATIIRTIAVTKSIRSASLNLSVPSTTQFDITNPVGTTMRCTYDGTGTDPTLPGNVSVGQVVQIQAQNFNAANKGTFIVTGTGTNYFEVTNAAVVAENNKTVGTGYILFHDNWTKPEGLVSATVCVQGAGGGGGGADAAGTDESAGSGGGGGGYAEKSIAADDLSATEVPVLGFAGLGGTTAGGDGNDGGETSFGSHVSASGGQGGFGDTTTPAIPGGGGTGSDGELNLPGGPGSGIVGAAPSAIMSGKGGDSRLGFGGWAGSAAGSTTAGQGFGSGGAGAFSNNGAATAGEGGANGVVVVYEYYE